MGKTKIQPEPEAWVQLATRVPRSLHRAVKLHCVTAGESVMTFCIEALQAKLAGSKSRKAS